MVLFPGMPLPLHIFEPRYQRMIGECIEARAPFGVLLESEGGRAEVGTAALVTAVIRRYPDGRSDIATEGRQRFRVRSTDEALPYLRGEVEWLEDPEEDAPAERARAIEAFRRTYAAHGLPLEPSAIAGDHRLSWTLARSSLLGLGERQEILETDPEAARLGLLAERFEAAVEVVRRVGGNGHGR